MADKMRKGVTANDAYAGKLYKNAEARGRAGDAARKMAKAKGGTPKSHYAKGGK